MRVNLVRRSLRYLTRTYTLVSTNLQTTAVGVAPEASTVNVSAGGSASSSSIAAITIETLTQKVAVLATRTDMLEGLVRNRPQSLRKLSTEILNEAAFLETALGGLDADPSDDRFALCAENIVRCRNRALHYFEAARGIEIDVECASSSVVPSFNSSSEGSTPAPQCDQFKLQKCRPLTFSGNVREFKQWYEHFELSVHQNPNLSDSVRIIHLLSSVRGEAKEFLRSYPATGEHYQRTLNALKDRFGDPTKLAQSFYSDFANLADLGTRPDGEVTIEMDRKNLDAIKAILLNLESTGCYDLQLAQGWVLRKMSHSRVSRAFSALAQAYPKLDFSLSELLGALESAVYIDEVIQLRMVTLSDSSEAPAKVTTMMGKTSFGSKGKFSSCVFCGNKHASKDCRTFGSFAVRKKRLHELGRCVACLDKHRLESCPNREVPCATCKKSGHSEATCFTVCRPGKASSSSSSPVKKKGGKVSSGSPSKKSKPADDANSTPEKTAAGTFLETFTCRVVVEGYSVSVRGMLDGGSNASYIHTNVLNSVGVRPSRQVALAVHSYGSESHSSMLAGSIQVEFLGIDGQRKGCTLLTSGCIVGNSRLAPSPREAAAILPPGYRYADPDLFSGSPRPIEVLIGNDLRNLFVRLNRDKQVAQGLVLKPTMFGWIPSGRALSLPDPVIHTTMVAKMEKGDKKNDPEFQSAQEIKFLWDLEVLGIRDSELNTTDDVVIEHFRRTTRFENGRYVVCWPRKTSKLELPSHYRMCVARLKSLLHATNREILDRCDEIIREQLAAGIIEKAPRESASTVHYVPHRPVVRDGKVRIVVDASAKLKNGRSLNDFLHTGPSLIGNLVEILINFRLKEIALSADIEKAFLRVGLDEADRDLVRFLWVDDVSQPSDNVTLVAYRFTRTPFGVVSSPFLLNMVLQEHFADAGEAIFQSISKRFYVDNFIMSVSSEVLAINTYEVVTERLASAGFNLRDWISNSKTFNDALPPNMRKSLEGGNSILGLKWDNKNDTMSVRFAEEPQSCQVTLRLALSVLAAVFDPLGLCLPGLLELKLFIQECWKAKVTMDEGLPALMTAQFRKLMLEREEIKDIRFPRYLWSSASSEGSYELHCFCDASKLSFGSAIYLVHKTRVESESQLIFAKLKVAPIQKRSIPQLELLGVLLGKRTVTFIRKLLPFTVARTIVWTDATTVIQWLHSLAVQPLFVHNRLTEIRQAENTIFRYVSTKDNPADLLTRGQKASRLRDNKLWWHGPSWLVQERLWPASPPTALEFDTAAPKVATLLLQSSQVELYFLTEANEKLLSWVDFIKRLLRVPPICKWYAKQSLSQSESFLRAELILIRLLQAKYYPAELRLLHEGLKPASDLDLFLHTDGVIRCRDRYETAPIIWDQAHPILLPRESPIIRTLLQKVHRACLHAGAEVTLLKFRERYWITKARSLVNSVIHRCNLCRRWKGGAYKLPPMPLLPQVRTAPIIPFLNVGLDCFGPLRVRAPGSSPLCTNKTYGTIFTCLVTRAVHLELAGDLSGDQFLQALTRFTSRRGKPKFIVSDNGTNFTFVQPLVGRRVELTDAKVNEFITENGIDWHFNPAHQPWQGGVYERLIGLVKDLLLKVLGRDVVDYITLATVLCQIEDIVNSRPLTYIPGNEISEPLTPNCFLRPAGNSASADLNVNPAAVSSRASTLLSGYKTVYALVEHFRSRFYSGYLQRMREKHVALHRSPRGAVKFAPGVGEMVLVKGLESRRSQWPLGVVERLDARGAQAWVRVVDWVATNKMTPLERAEPRQLHRTKLVQKAVNSLYPLEVRPQIQDSATSAPAAQMPRLDF